jgi:hypothetical protein
MPAASPAAGLLGLPSEPLVRGLGDELGATMVRQLVSDVGMHGVLLEVCLSFLNAASSRRGGSTSVPTTDRATESTTEAAPCPSTAQ